MTNAMAVFLLRFAASVAVLALWACSGDNFAPGPNGASQALVSAPVAATGTEIIFSSNVRDWFVTDVYSMRRMALRPNRGSRAPLRPRSFTTLRLRGLRMPPGLR